MPEAAGRSVPAATPRHAVPLVDDAALAAARHGDRLVAAAREAGLERWRAYLEPLPERLRDGDLRDLRQAALRARAAYGPKDSIRDVIGADLTEPFLEAIDRLLKVLARRAIGA
jgi:hypothetical protein